MDFQILPSVLVGLGAWERDVPLSGQPLPWFRLPSTEFHFSPTLGGTLSWDRRKGRIMYYP